MTVTTSDSPGPDPAGQLKALPWAKWRRVDTSVKRQADESGISPARLDAECSRLMALLLDRYPEIVARYAGGYLKPSTIAHVVNTAALRGTTDDAQADDDNPFTPEEINQLTGQKE